MTLHLTPERREVVNAKLDRLLEHVQAARNADLLSLTDRALNEAWFALHDAQDAVREADRQTRRDAEIENERRARERISQALEL